MKTFLKHLPKYLPALYPILITSFFVPTSIFSPASNTMVLATLIFVVISLQQYLYYKNTINKNHVDIMLPLSLLFGALAALVMFFSTYEKPFSLALFGKGVVEWSIFSVFFLAVAFIAYFNTNGSVRKLSFLSSVFVISYTIFNFLGSKYFPSVGQYTGYINIPMFSFSKLFNYPFLFSLVAFAGLSLSMILQKFNIKLKTIRFPAKTLLLVVLVLSVLWAGQYLRRTLAATYFNSAVTYIKNSDIQNASKSLDKAIFISPLDQYYLGKIDVINIQISQLTQNMTAVDVASSSQYKSLVDKQIENAQAAVNYDNAEPANYAALAQAYQRSIVYQKEVGYRKAIATYNELGKISNEKDAVETLKANTAFSVGDTAAGVAYLNSALDMNASSTSALYTYSQYYSSLKENIKAIDYAERAVLTRPDSFDTHANLAVMYMYGDRYKDASIQWYTALQISQNNPMALYYLAYSLISAHLYDDAQKVIAIFEKSTSDANGVRSLRDMLITIKNQDVKKK